MTEVVHNARSKLPTVWFGSWLGTNRTQNTPYGITYHAEVDRPEDVVERLAEVIFRSKSSDRRLMRMLSRVSWIPTSARLDPPQMIQGQLGDFGEAVAIGLLEVFKYTYVPVVKLRYQMDKDQSLHGTDIVGFVFDPGDEASILSLDFCEVKTSTSTKYNARDAVGAAHTQLADDRKEHFTDTLEFLAERLEETHPKVAMAFEDYLASRDDGPGGSNRIVLLTDSQTYGDIVFDKIPGPPDLQEPLEFDIVVIENLRTLVEDTWPLVTGRATIAAAALDQGGERDANQ